LQTNKSPIPETNPIHTQKLYQPPEIGRNHIKNCDINGLYQNFTAATTWYRLWCGTLSRALDGTEAVDDIQW
jgi:hypothetical protein